MNYLLQNITYKITLKNYKLKPTQSMKLRINLLRLRHKKEMTQASFGEMLGISKGMVQSYEDGRAEPSLHTIKKIVDTFGIDDLYLFLYASSK